MTLGPSEPLIPSTIVDDIDRPGLRRVGIIVGAVDAERLHVSVERLLHGLRVHTIDGFVATGVLLWLARRRQLGAAMHTQIVGTNCSVLPLPAEKSCRPLCIVSVI